jgi:hypothetical protein
LQYIERERKRNKKKMKLSTIAITIISWMHIISHLGLFVVDYGQAIHLIDFIVRQDGTRSDPHNLLPTEMIFGALTGIAFSSVGISYLLSLVFNIGTVQSSAVLSVWLHAIWVFHIIWKWETWRSFVHIDASVQPDFFLISHIVWTVLSLIVIILSSTTKSTLSSKTKPM